MGYVRLVRTVFSGDGGNCRLELMCSTHSGADRARTFLADCRGNRGQETVEVIQICLNNTHRSASLRGSEALFEVQSAATARSVAKDRGQQSKREVLLLDAKHSYRGKHQRQVSKVGTRKR